MAGALIELTQATGDGLQTALVGAGATLLAALLGFGGIVWQIGRQARSAIAQQRDSERLKMKLQIYEHVVPLIERAIHAEVTLNGLVRNFSFELQNVATLSAAALPWSPPATRFPKCLEARRMCDDATIALIQCIERWEIVDPRLRVFQTAINVATGEASLAWDLWYRTALPLMPMEQPDGKLFPWNPPADTARAQLDLRVVPVGEALGRLGSWIHDFRIELQIAMLGELFSGEITRRNPIDPKYLVITLERADELQRYFEDETEWGRSFKQAKADAQSALGGTK